MKLFLLILLLTVSTFAETIWRNKYYDANGVDYPTTFTSNQAIFTAAGTFYTQPFVISEGENLSTGLWGIATKLDSIAADTSAGGAAQPDTLDFYAEYWMGKTIGWVTGQKMEWHTRVDTSGATSYPSSVSQLIDSLHHGTVYYWQSDPADEISLFSFPYQRVRIKMVITRTQGNVNVGIKQEFFLDSR